MALLAIFCGIVIPILFIYYCFKDMANIARREEHERKIEEMEKEFEAKYGKLRDEQKQSQNKKRNKGGNV